MTRYLARPALILVPLALLAACSSDESAPPPEENGVEMLDVTNEAVNVEEAPLTMNTPAPLNDTVPEDAPVVPEDEQIRADADATGMTARVDRESEDEAPAANSGAAVSEEK